MKYIEAIITTLQDRFPDTDHLDAFCIFDPQKVPTIPEQQVIYGQERIEHLQEVYGEGENADVDGAECASEWEGLKRLFF